MNWARLPIKRIADVFLGKMIQPESKSESDVSAPYLRAAHVQPNGQIIDVDDKTMWFRDGELARHDLRRGDVVIVEGGAGYGRSAVIRDDREGWGFQNSIVRVRPHTASTSGKYLHYSLQSALATGEVEVACFTSTIPHFTADKVGAFQVPVPPVGAQRAIADYLDRETARIDALIEEQQRLIEMLCERRTAVISSALTPTDAWVRRRIKHVGETNLGKMLDAGRAIRDGDQPRPYVRAADVRADGSVNLVDLNEMPFSDAEMDVFDLRAGDVLLIEGGATVGRPGFMFESAAGIAFQKTVNRLRVGQQTDGRFVYWSMLRLYESAYYANHYGSVSFAHLTGEKLREIELHLPPLDEQRTIAIYLDEQTAKIDTLIAETERFIELSKERRAALVMAAVTGQIDVREMA